MASITNRANLVITVPKRGELTKHFPYNSKEAKPYFKSLEAQGYKPHISQLILSPPPAKQQRRQQR